MFDPDTTVQNDLRGGLAPWHVAAQAERPAVVTGNFHCEILIIGAGITGALLTEHLTSLGHQVCTIDRELPGLGSTAASTAMLLWEIDCRLSQLTDFYGFDRAAHIYRQSLRAVTGLKKLVTNLRLPCAFRNRNSLYLAAGSADEGTLQNEHKLRERAGLPGTYLDYLTLLREFGMSRPGAILSSGAAEADPVLLAQHLLSYGAQHGAQIFHADALDYESTRNHVVVTLATGHVIKAKYVVLATGYVMPDFVKSTLHQTACSWAIATVPQEPRHLWRDRALLWEASENYLYARTTRDGRIIIGGEDEETGIAPDERNGMMPDKAERLLKSLHQLWPKAEAKADFIWSGAFGKTKDGLPLIGKVPDHSQLFAAYGYGGNGITFSYLASRLIGKMIAGEREAWFDDFALERQGPSG